MQPTSLLLQLTIIIGRRIRYIFIEREKKRLKVMDCYFTYVRVWNISDEKRIKGDETHFVNVRSTTLYVISYGFGIYVWAWIRVCACGGAGTGVRKMLYLLSCVCVSYPLTGCCWYVRGFKCLKRMIKVSRFLFVPHHHALMFTQHMQICIQGYHCMFWNGLSATCCIHVRTLKICPDEVICMPGDSEGWSLLYT